MNEMTIGRAANAAAVLRAPHLGAWPTERSGLSGLQFFGTHEKFAEHDDRLDEVTPVARR